MKNKLNKCYFWDQIDAYINKEATLKLDEHHSFGKEAELYIDRTESTPLADNRVVHYDPLASSYVLLTGGRIRFNSIDNITVFPETSPWDTQIRMDSPVTIPSTCTTCT